MIFKCSKCTYEVDFKPGMGMVWWLDYIQCPKCKQEIKNPILYDKENNRV